MHTYTHTPTPDLTYTRSQHVHIIIMYTRVHVLYNAQSNIYSSVDSLVQGEEQNQQSDHSLIDGHRMASGDRGVHSHEVHWVEVLDDSENNSLLWMVAALDLKMERVRQWVLVGGVPSEPFLPLPLPHLIDVRIFVGGAGKRECYY